MAGQAAISRSVRGALSLAAQERDAIDFAFARRLTGLGSALSYSRMEGGRLAQGGAGGFLAEAGPDFAGPDERAAADAGAAGEDVVRPGFRIHVFGPEGPGAALVRSSSVYAAAVAFQKYAGGAERPQMEKSAGFHAVPPGESLDGQPQMAGQAFALGQRGVHVAVASAGEAATSAALAGKADSLGILAGVRARHGRSL
jgi:hypothetical protein